MDREILSKRKPTHWESSFSERWFPTAITTPVSVYKQPKTGRQTAGEDTILFLPGFPGSNASVSWRAWDTSIMVLPLTQLTERGRAQATERFVVLKPVLEGQEQLAAIAGQHQLSLRTLQPWGARLVPASVGTGGRRAATSGSTGCRRSGGHHPDYGAQLPLTASFADSGGTPVGDQRIDSGDARSRGGGTGKPRHWRSLTGCGRSDK
jgi:hypothetical protein